MLAPGLEAEDADEAAEEELAGPVDLALEGETAPASVLRG
ncbi:MAG: hypothetical protein JWO64_2375, partial [Hyphomicrobiales bacterium]|nr:hypothetical protein [Hyphomicrobiales bacterium]